MSTDHRYSWECETPADAAERLGLELVGIEAAIRDGEIECLSRGKISWLDPATVDAWAQKRGILAFRSKVRLPRAHGTDAPAVTPRIPPSNGPREQALASAAKQLGLDPTRVAAVAAEREHAPRPTDAIESLAAQLGVDPAVMRKRLEERRRAELDAPVSVDPIATTFDAASSVADQLGVDPEAVRRNLAAYRRAGAMEVDMRPRPTQRRPSEHEADAGADADQGVRGELANVANQLGLDPSAVRGNYDAAMRELARGGRS